MLKRAHYITLGVVILLTLIVLKLPDRTLRQLKLAVSSVFLPLFGLTESATHLTVTSSDALVPREQLLGDLDRFRQENQQLKLRLIQLEATERENLRFREYHSWPRPSTWKLKLARVVARDPANWWRTLKINLGRRDGIATNCPVLSGTGVLVGRVSAVAITQSQVVLVGDPDCRVGVLIEESRDNGIIAPSSSSPLDNSIVDLNYLSRNSPMQSGQKVVTSGLGGVFPKGIPVGQIIDWRTVGYGLYNEARVSLAVNLNTLEDVWIIMP